MTYVQSKSRLVIKPESSKLSTAKCLGAALGPGTVSGLVDIGLLLGLKQHGINIDMVSGTSMGALFAALYAMAYSPEEIRDIITELFENKQVTETLQAESHFPYVGLPRAPILIEEVRRIIGSEPTFLELETPLFITASDKNTQQSVVLRQGNVLDAVRASLTQPLCLDTKIVEGKELADGSIFTPVDTNTLYTEGADFVIAIHAKILRSDRRRSQPLPSRLQPYFMRLLGWQSDPEIYFSKPDCDILLRPRVPRRLLKDFNNVDDIINLGVKITYDAIFELKQQERKH